MVKKLTVLIRKGLCILSLFVFTTEFFNVYAGVDPATAWWNSADFEEYAVRTNMNSTDIYPNSDLQWKFETGYPTSVPGIEIRNVGTNTGNASGKAILFAHGAADSDDFGEGNNNRYFSVSKSFANTLTGIVYVKFSAYSATRGSLYTFVNSDGEPVFGVGGRGQSSSNDLGYTLDLPVAGGDYLTATTTPLGISASKRSNWAQWEFLLDLTNKKVLKMIVTYNNALSTFEDISLTNGGNIAKFYVASGKYNTGGLDNITIGNLAGDNIKDLTGESTLITIPEQAVGKTYSVTAFTTSMELTLEAPNPALDVTWSVSDWGTLASEEQSLVTLTRNADDYTQAELSVSGAIAADAVITLKAATGDTELTLPVTLKAPSADALKVDLLAEIEKAEALTDAITDSNPFLSGIIATLETAIGTAQGVYDNVSATLAAVNQAIEDMKTAQTAFATALAPYTAFVESIAAAQALHDAETRDAPFFTAIKSTLNAAIATATAARNSITSESDIAAAQTTLAAALAQFAADIPVYAALETAIALNTTIRNNANARAGEKFLNYTTTVISAMDDAISIANNVLSTGTAVETFNTAITALNEAITAQKALRNPPAAQYSYKIFTYGVDDGDGNDVKKTLYDDGTTLKYSETSNPSTVENAEWNITEVSSGVYTIQNKATGKYINGAEFSDTPANLTLPENTAQNGDIKKDDVYFLYGIGNVSTRYLEVNTDNGFTVNSALPNRLRFCFQFEETISTGISNIEVDNDPVVAVKYYTLQGVEIQRPVTGAVCVVKKIHASQKVTVTKEGKW